MIPDNFYYSEREFKRKYKSIIDFFLNNTITAIYYADVNKALRTNCCQADYYFDDDVSRNVFDYLVLSDGLLYYFYEDEAVNCYLVERLAVKKNICGYIENEFCEDEKDRFIETEIFKYNSCKQVLDVVPHYNYGGIDGFTLIFKNSNLSLIMDSYPLLKINEPAQKYIKVKQHRKIYSLIESFSNEKISKENSAPLPRIVYNGLNVGLCYKYENSTELKKLISRNYLGISYSSYVDKFELVETLMRLTMDVIWSNPEVPIFYYKNMCEKHNCKICVIKEFCKQYKAE